MNPDATIENDTIYKLYKIIKNKKDIAAISPHIVNLKGETQYSGSKINWKNCIILNEKEKEKHLEYLTTDVFHGCACLFDANKFFEAGMFDVKTFMYYDEAFLSMEFSKLYYKILYSPDNLVHHQNSLSIGNFSFLKSYYHTRNHLMFFKKYSKDKNIFCKYYSIIKNLGSLIKHFRLYAIFGMIKGIFDFWIHKSGKLR